MIKYKPLRKIPRLIIEHIFYQIKNKVTNSYHFVDSSTLYVTTQTYPDFMKFHKIICKFIVKKRNHENNNYNL